MTPDLNHTEVFNESNVMSSSVMQRIKGFFSFYFLEGQLLRPKDESIATGSIQTFWDRYRKPISLMFPVLVVHTIWWSIMISHDLFYLFTEPSGSFDMPRYLLSITMIFGSLIAGATSEGGGAVAFPVMTLVLGVAPDVARDFAFMIQSVGMTSASFAILVMRVQVEWQSLKYVTLGGIGGIIFGLEQVVPRLAPAYSKMYFVVIWAAFAVGLYLLNRHWDRKVYLTIPNWEEGELWRYGFLCINWKREVLILFGFGGGICSAISGSGIDICSFACLTLLFRVSEKVATPTSVLLMSVNTVVGFAYREFCMGGVETDAWGFWAVCVPVVVIGAPVGAFLGSHCHRLVMAGVIYVIDSVQLVGALVIIKPWTTLKTNSPLHLSLTSVAIFVSCFLLFQLLSMAGLKMMETIEAGKQTDNGENDKKYKKNSTLDMAGFDEDSINDAEFMSYITEEGSRP